MLYMIKAWRGAASEQLFLSVLGNRLQVKLWVFDSLDSSDILNSYSTHQRAVQTDSSARG